MGWISTNSVWSFGVSNELEIYFLAVVDLLTHINESEVLEQFFQDH